MNKYKMNKIKRHLVTFCILFVFIFCAGHSCFADSIPQDKSIKIELWAEIDCYPEIKESEERAKNHFLSLSHFILEGMVYGFDFCYTPYDKTRGVQDDFSLVPVVPYATQNYGKINWSVPHIKDNLLYYWLEFTRTPAQQQYYNNRVALNSKKIKGQGTGKIKDGFEGIKQGFSNCAKNAVREYARGITKNKPQRVEGRLFLVGDPRIYAKNGDYVCVLDFFVEIDTIVQYNVY